MLEFLLKVWGLTKPYRGRLFLGILTGIISGFLEPLMIATIAFVYALIFPSAGSPPLASKLDWAPASLKTWLLAAQEALTTGVRAHPLAVVGLAAMTPAVIFLPGLLSFHQLSFP